MPWTFAHPAAVLPLRRMSASCRLSFAALVIGSLSPDFAYYVGCFDLATFAHTPLGVLLVCVPAGMLVLIVGRWLQGPIAGLLPQPHRSAVLALAWEQDIFRFRALSTAVLSLVLGALTHLLWDAFTHEGRFFVQQIPLLRLLLFTALNREFYVFNLLQHASTVGGVLLLGMAYYRYAHRFARSDAVLSAADRRRCAVLVLVVIAAFIVAMPFVIHDAITGKVAIDVSKLLVRQAMYATTAFFVLLSGAGFWVKWRGDA